MSGQCTVCGHTEITDITAELLQGNSATAVGIRYGLSHDAVSRHKREHMTELWTGSENVVLLLQDVKNIPLEMKERGDLIKSLLYRALEPLFRITEPEIRQTRRGPRVVRPIEMVPLGFVVQLLKLQQQDEQTIMRVTGQLKDDDHIKRADLVVSDQWRVLREQLERQMLEAAGGERERMVEMQVAMADYLLEQGEREARQDSAPNGPSRDAIEHEAWNGWGENGDS